MTPTIRSETVSDYEAIRRVNCLAFGQDEEAKIVEALRESGSVRLSLVAELSGQIVGHIVFSDLPILTDTGPVMALSLAPMAVLPEYQKQGIGSALVRKGLEVCREQGQRIVVVLGHPTYYPRFGFSTKLAQNLLSPFADHTDAWMALELVPGALHGVHGWVQYPAAFGIGVTVRPMYKPDQAEWLRMRTAFWPEETEQEHNKEIADYFAKDSFQWSNTWRVFVAQRTNNQLCGFVETSLRPYVDGCATAPVGYIEGWYVDPDLRKQGIGKQLITAAERWAIQQGCQEIASDALLENTISQQAHKNLGFEETERVVLFRKPLTEISKAESKTTVASYFKLTTIAGLFAVCKLPSDSPIPTWATSGQLFSITRTADELSIVCRQEQVPEGILCERSWGCLRIVGSMPFTLVGVLASLTAPIAKVGVGLFAISTFDTDYLLIQSEDMPKAIAALRQAGHSVEIG